MSSFPGMSADFDGSGDQTSAPTVPDQNQPSPIQKVLASLKPKKKQRSAAGLAGAIAASKRARQGNHKYGN